MKQDSKILFFYPPENEQAKKFVMNLSGGLSAWNIKTAPVRLTTVLFEVRSSDVAHFFLPATTFSAQVLKKLKGKRPFLQTLLSTPDKVEQYDPLLFGDEIIVFSEVEKSRIEKRAPGAAVTVVPPCIVLPEVINLRSPQETRNRFGAQDRLLVLALSDFSEKRAFKTFLYIAREYQRSGGFRFLIPSFRKGKDAATWRASLQASLDHEKLSSTTLLDDSVELQSLLDSADIVLYIQHGLEREFGFPLQVAEALSLGKPVISSKPGAVSEMVASFRPGWVANDAEDFVRISKDLLKEAVHLEQISTDLARFARPRFSVPAVAAAYQKVYQRFLHPEVVH